MHGGMKTYRGTPAAARAYVEADRSRADDYYLAEGSGLAMRFVVSHDQNTHTVSVHRAEDMDGAVYETWVAGYDAATGAAKGRLRDDEHAVRFVEVTVNGPKTWSLAAALHPAIGRAYDAAQQRAATEIIGWLAEHATTRIGPRGRQVQVGVDEIEAAVVRHYTSRAGDPHRHLHLQVNARVRASGRWRGLHTVGVRDSLAALNGIGHAAVMTDPQFRAALAAHGYHLDAESGEVVELARYAGAFSARTRQIEQNIDRYEAAWRTEHPGEEPGPMLRQAWDRRAWADARPDKVVPTSGAELSARWVEELHEAGFRSPTGAVPPPSMRIGRLDRSAAVAEVISRLGARRSAWNAADVRGEVEQYLACAGVVTEAPVRRELAEHLTALAVSACTPLLGRDDVPEHVRDLTSAHVLGVEREIASRIAARVAADAPAAQRGELAGSVDGLDADQRAAVAHLTGSGSVLVVEGAAGAGKTATLAAARAVLMDQGHRMVVVTPTRKAALVAEGQIGAASYSVAWLLHQHGFRWDDAGHWERVVSEPDIAARMRRGDLLVVDEAGMLDQDTARALMRLADQTGVRVALVGDRHQLPAVGRGGVLDLAARYAPCLTLEGVHRFADPEYAGLSLRMRRGEDPGAVFDALVARGEIALHPSEVEQQVALAARASHGELVVADTREQVGRINGLAHHVRVVCGEASDGVVTAVGERIGVGDRIATRRNSVEGDVANRETWTVAGCEQGALTVVGDAGQRTLPADYVRRHVELAYATTAHGAQGVTVPVAHVLVGEHTGAATAYVGMTRGRDRNIGHMVADSLEAARQQWIDVFGRDRADLGPARAAARAAEDVERYAPKAPTRRLRRQPGWRRPPEPYRAPPSRDPAIGL